MDTDGYAVRTLSGVAAASVLKPVLDVSRPKPNIRVTSRKVAPPRQVVLQAGPALTLESRQSARCRPPENSEKTHAVGLRMGSGKRLSSKRSATPRRCGRTAASNTSHACRSPAFASCTTSYTPGRSMASKYTDTARRWAREKSGLQTHSTKARNHRCLTGDSGAGPNINPHQDQRKAGRAVRRPTAPRSRPSPGPGRVARGASLPTIKLWSAAELAREIVRPAVVGTAESGVLPSASVANRAALVAAALICQLTTNFISVERGNAK
jgi:hypothetical protein